LGEPLLGEPLGLFHHPEQVFLPYLLELRAQTAQAELRRRLVVGMKLDPGGHLPSAWEQIPSSGCSFDTIPLSSGVPSFGP
jgi:hypothetical protein